jgi:hypothetical protein
MEQIKELSKFYAAAKEDPRIGTAHISLYMAIFQEYNLNQFKNPLKIKRSSLMATAKINGLATYHKCIKDLAASGYIQYIPSYNPSINSQIIILDVS